MCIALAYAVCRCKPHRVFVIVHVCFWMSVCMWEEGREFSLLLSTKTLHWNVNWYDWSASQIRHKAAFNKPKIRMSHCLAPLRRGRGRGCVSVRSGVCWNPSFPLPAPLLLNSTSRRLITNRKTELLQSVRWFTGRLKAHILLRRDRKGFEVMLMRILLVLQI